MIRKADFFSETPDQTVFTNLSLTFFRAKSVSAKISVSGLVTLEFKEVQVYMPAKLKDHLSAGEKLQVVATGTFRLNLLSDALVQVDQYFGRAAKLADFLDKPRIASPKQEDQKP